MASGPLAPDVEAASRRAADDGYAEGLRRGYDDGRLAAIADAQAYLSFALTAIHGAIEDLHHRDVAGAAVGVQRAGQQPRGLRHRRER